METLERRGIASTAELRSECPAYRSRHRRGLFWIRLSELEADGAVDRAGEKRAGGYVESLWKLPTGGPSLKVMACADDSLGDTT